MIDHVTLGVSDLGRARAFYDRALVPLGIIPMVEGDDFTGYGYGAGKCDFWIGRRDAVLTGVHIAFTADARTKVDAFHAAALAAGGRDNGKPGLRPQYRAHYYGAFVLDPDGHNIEAVCYAPE
jgi:catechol 2,3-dioxygenase-like lactoylglutathione lyase family enzyme